MKNTLITFLIILGIILGLIHLDVIAIWVKAERTGILQTNILSGHTRVNPIIQKAQEKK